MAESNWQEQQNDNNIVAKTEDRHLNISSLNSSVHLGFDWMWENQVKSGEIRTKTTQASSEWDAAPSWRSQLVAGGRTHQGDDGALGGELRGAEQRPDKAVDLLLLGVVLVVIGGDLGLLQQEEEEDAKLQGG